MRKILLIALLYLISGCASAPNHNYISPQEKWNTIKKSWIGEHYSKFIQVKGAYTSKSEDGLGGEIFVWSQHQEAVHKTTSNPLAIFNEWLDVKEPAYIDASIDSKTTEHHVFCDSTGAIYDIKIFVNGKRKR